AIVRLARERANTLITEGKEVKFFCVGRKGYDQLRRVYEKQIIEHIELRGVRKLGFEHAEKIGDKVLRLYKEGAFDICTLFFSRFKSIIAQIPTAQQIIPPVFEGNAGNDNGVVYEYEPDEDEILVELLPRNISVQIFAALLENGASFYGAQMTAMDNATRNAGEMIRKQTLTYNRTRQAMITKELIEIISGAEAVRRPANPYLGAITRTIHGQSSWARYPGHRRRRRRAFRGASAAHSRCARDQESGSPSRARSRAASRRVDRANCRNGHDRGPRAWARGRRYRRTDRGTGQGRHFGPHHQRDRRTGRRVWCRSSQGEPPDPSASACLHRPVDRG